MGIHNRARTDLEIRTSPPRSVRSSLPCRSRSHTLVRRRHRGPLRREAPRRPWGERRNRRNERSSIFSHALLEASPLEEAEARLKIRGDDFKAKGAALVRALKEEVVKGDAGAFTNASPVAMNHEGYRVRVDEGGGKFGWFLLRQSLHDPVCVLNFESDARGGVSSMAGEFLGWFDTLGLEDVDVSAVRAVAK